MGGSLTWQSVMCSQRRSSSRRSRPHQGQEKERIFLDAFAARRPVSREIREAVEIDEEEGIQLTITHKQNTHTRTPSYIHLSVSKAQTSEATSLET